MELDVGSVRGLTHLNLPPPKAGSRTQRRVRGAAFKWSAEFVGTDYALRQFNPRRWLQHAFQLTTCSS